MQKCENCGKEVIYIATRSGLTVKCDDKLIILYTENGRKCEGYVPHSCEVNNAKKDKE